MEIIILLLGLLFTAITFANPISDKIPRLFIFHINGVNTTIDKAIKNLEALEDVTNIISNAVRWDLLYNETHGLLTGDLWDVMKMKKQEGQSLSIYDYVLTYMKRNNLNYPIDSKEYNELKDQIKMKYINDLQDGSGRNFSDLIAQLTEKIFPEIVEKRAYVLLLPHSQGNLYANQLWKYFVNNKDDYYRLPKSHIALFGLASPTDHMEGIVKPIPPASQENYYTADNDYVINSLSILTSFMPQTKPPMPGNMHLVTCKDFLCHALIDAYLMDQSSRQLISNKIHSLIISLKKNLIEEQLGKNSNGLNALFWMDEKLSSSAILRSKNGEIICASGKCDDYINYLETNLSDWDPYKNYKWSSNWPIGEEYYLLIPHDQIQNFITPKDYFVLRGSLGYVVDSSNVDCFYYKRNRLSIDNSPASPFFGKAYGAISTVVNNGCKIPDYMLVDNQTKVVLGTFLINV